MQLSTLALALFAARAAATSLGEEVAEAALASDEQCDNGAEGSEACALHALQRRGQIFLSVDANYSGSCHSYGCGSFDKSHSCQCNGKCSKFGNCCSDYNSVCSSSGGSSCHAYGCGKYVKGQSCQCNGKCEKYGNCCSDFAPTCDAAGGGSCHAYGCGTFVKGHSCQCNDKCEKFGNCCSDHKSKCAAPSGTCHAYGCGKYDKSRSCQCTAQCAEHGNCCADYAATCSASSGTCSAYGCGKFDKDQSCQCTAKCAKYGNCCPDYKGTCEGGHHHQPGKISGHPTAGKAYPSHHGFTLALVEEFDTPLDLDSDPIWTWSDGGLIEGQIRYGKDAIKFSDGKMKISVSNHVPHVQACSHAEVTLIPKKKLYSGEVRTKHNMFRYGRYEASIKAPTVQPGNTKVNGNYVATMFVFRDAKYKHWREIDIEITGDKVDSLHTNVLSAEETREWRADMGEEGDKNVGVNVRNDFHTYAIEWLPHKITWFFDGKVVREKKGGKIPIPNLSTKIMMNLWVFDDTALFGGKEIKNDRFPMHTEYDWFRFYKWDGDKHYPCAGLGTQCLSADDKYLSSNNPCDGIAQVGTVYGKAPCHAKCH